MKIKRTDYGAITVLAPRGDLAGDDVQAFRDEAQQCMTQGGAGLIVDCSAITGFDSVGLEMLTELAWKCQEQGGAIKIGALDANGRKIFEMTRLNRMFELHDDIESAIRSFA